MKQSSYLNQSGFSIVNLVVGMGIGVVVMAGFVSAMQVMNRAKQTTDVKLAASDFIDQLQATAIKPDGCATTLAGQSVPPSAAKGVLGTEVGLNFGAISEGQEIAKGVRIKTLKIRATKPPLVAPGNQIYYSMPARIQVEIENTMVNPPVKLRGRFIPIQLTVDSSYKIVNCGKVDTQAQVCEQLGGVWDVNAPEGLQCMPTDKCLYGGSYSDAPASGTDANGAPFPGYINTFTGGQSCPTAFDPQMTGTVQVARKESKYRVVYDTYRNYTCVRCYAKTASTVVGTPGTPLESKDLDGTGEGTADAFGADGAGATYGNNITNICQQLGFGC